jgi:hypothetical protein
MVAVVSTERLDLIPSGRRLPNGKREYLTTKIGTEQFGEIRRGVASALGLLSLCTSSQTDTAPSEPQPQRRHPVG